MYNSSVYILELLGLLLSFFGFGWAFGALTAQYRRAVYGSFEH